MSKPSLSPIRKQIIVKDVLAKAIEKALAKGYTKPHDIATVAVIELELANIGYRFASARNPAPKS